MSVVIKRQPVRVFRRVDGQTRGLFLGRSAETGVWRASTSRRMLKWRGHDSLFVALGRFRLRIMKPSAYQR